MTTTLVRVNITPLREQVFHPCTPDFIANVCHGACCRSTVDPTGIAVVVTPAEAVRLRRRGATVDDQTGRIAPQDRRCPFQDATTHLCTVHTDDEPMGCAISPFTVNANGTLIVRNRYRLLKCFRADGAIPVAHAHRRSLDLIFGAAAATVIVNAVDRGSDATLTFPVPTRIVTMLHHKNTASKPEEA
jgi:hypothetical protein